MLSLPTAVQIYLATEPADMREGFDGLAALVFARGLDIYSGHLFVFVAKRRDRVKILTFDRGGFVLYYKRLERGRFKLPLLSGDSVRLDAGQLAMLPFYRLAKRLQRDGVPIERNTLDRLFHRTAELCEPLVRRILELVIKSERINADETPVFVQAPERCRRGFMWTFVADKLIAYEFSPSRSGETPQNLLGGTTGLLQVDGYTGYNAVCVPEGRRRVGCLAHARRKFFNALSSAPQDAETALEHILSLYEVEYEAARRGIPGTPEHLAMCKTVTAERMKAFRSWMDEKQGVWPPKGPMGEALRYGIKTLETLAPILDDPKVRLDNNIADGALRLVALGRKNFLFVGDDQAGRNLAVLQTLVSTCLANEVNPEAYLADVLLRLEDTPRSRIDELLPMNWKPPATSITPGPAP